MCIVCQGVQCHTWKKHIPTKSQFSHKMTLLKSQQKSQSHLKSNFLFTPISNICLEKFSSWLELTISRHLVIDIYWYQSTNRRFIYSHLFIHSLKGIYTFSQTTLMRMYQQIWELNLKNITSKMYAESCNSN